MSNNKRTVYLRVDGSKVIGYGHIFRCIALAQMLNTEFNCIFATRIFDSFLKNTISQVGFDIIELQQDESHYSEFLDKLAGDEIVVLDNYFFETSYQIDIKQKGCKLVCIDDIHNKHYTADIVINHSEGINQESYSIEKYTKLLLGYKYTLLRPEFLEASKQEKIISNKKKDVLISLGGTDPEDLIIKIVNTFLKHPIINSISLISKIDCSKFDNPDNKEIKEYWELNASELYNTMLNSDIGFLPASTISVEACACKLPFIGGWFVDNQVNIYRAIINKGLALGIGNINELSVGELYKAISDISIHENATRIASHQSRVIDGNSGARILKAFKQIC
ncbi:UDP-2,4-diacetamido-2,4,6-trideoxy-beta-L-altropyranose hydrolase [Plebeiibacterium marinum]|uniref:UDP-2,4-diacetamido-2,4, 6-trideoxy-beta-L-altropyranose hydrolase n=1 Tax=Plebeiibacterium marinum TaxID=2992111 RepID=A0AAE3MHA2_9BACT|nr:UDP-2,4-diacetamido-2,4,6-trideoxy-beta-L-altropyranose hydrolase [Plebeiobacterium marinum]MCW3807465.1 UDP-2,4-diacetamido-2,4,6-trideoxy-beta-L-altropyranose hydrolase [Plebeiobacterium marinum]